MTDTDAEDPTLINYVAAAMRAADGDHTMGTGQLAEVAVAAVGRFEEVALRSRRRRLLDQER